MLQDCRIAELIDCKVSIPFKREGAFKEGQDIRRGSGEGRGFHSLQAGRGIQRYEGKSWKTSSQSGFPFPSSGKGHSKPSLGDNSYSVSNVSIPFKREGAFKDANKKIARAQTTHVSIPFKREGAFKVTVLH